ncbi:MAG: Zn-ribbon domain-containing OB-fold protein [Desulfurococcaceae archaeon]
MRIVIPSSWRTRIHRYRLIATKCMNCHRTMYPPSSMCRYCGSNQVEEIELINEKAKLLTWTIIYSVMDGFENKKPVILGILETLESKARILAPLTDILKEELEPGIIMEPVLRRINEEGEHGLIYYGIAYRPVIK